MKKATHNKKSWVIGLSIAIAVIAIGAALGVTLFAEGDVTTYSYKGDTPFFNDYMENEYVYNPDAAPSKWFAELPLAENPNNFSSLNTTTFANINGKDVTVDSFYRTQNESLNDPNFGEGILIYQCIQYKVAHPEADVSIMWSAYRLSVTAGVCVDPNSKYYGHMGTLYTKEYDESGFVRISFMLVEAARMGIHVDIVPHLNSLNKPQDADNAKGYATVKALSYKTYFNSVPNKACYSKYAAGKKVSDYLKLHQVEWNVDERGSDMHHVKTCIVSNYLDKDGIEHGKSIFLTSANLDETDYLGRNGQNGAQSGIIISDHDELYNVTKNYLNVITHYLGTEEVGKFRDYVSTAQVEQIDLIRAGRGDEIPEDQQIVYLGTENDPVFEMYFTPLPGAVDVWDTEYNPYCKYISEMANSEDSIVFTWTMPYCACTTKFEHTVEDMIYWAFHKNRNPNNRIYMQFEAFDANKYNDLVVGTDLAFKKINQNSKKIHSKDIIMSYQLNGERKYVSIITSCNFGHGPFWYRSNSLLVVKETDAQHDVYTTIGAASTYGAIVDDSETEVHDYVTETVEAGETNRGYTRYTCKNCGDTYYRNINFEGYTGKTFTANDEYYIPYNFVNHDITIEAAISVPTVGSDRMGTIVGSYVDSKTDNIWNLEIYTKGRPRLYYRVDGVAYTCQFSTDVRSDDIKNIAVTVDDTKACLYVEGVLKETKTLTKAFAITGDRLRLGGDYRSNNAQYFRGTLYYLNIYTDARSQSEIQNDIRQAEFDDDNIAVAYNFMTADNMTDAGKCGKDLVTKFEGLHCESVEDRYSLTDAFETVPRTFEAYLDCSANVSNGKGCTITGNYNSDLVPGVSFRISNDGRPSLCLRYDKDTQDQFTIPQNILKTGRVHIAFTIDETNVYGYLNNTLMLTKAHRGYLPELLDSPFSVGGDNSEGNGWWFRDGDIYSLNLFSEYRTQEQVKNDMAHIDLNDNTLMVSYDFMKSLTSDYSSNHNELLPYYFEGEFMSSDEYDYTFAVVGDTQRIALTYPERFADIYSFLVQNRTDLKIQRVIGVGDITNEDSDAEWTVAKNAISQMDGLISYSLVRGNHDCFHGADRGKAYNGVQVPQSTKFEEYFANATYMQQYDGAYQNDIKNTYTLAEYNGIKYLFLNLDFGPSDDVLSWAGHLCEFYSDYNVIITTHCFLYRDGTTLDDGDLYPATGYGFENDGDDIWEELGSKYENISLIICGHDPDNDVVVSEFTGDHGNKVKAILVAQQSVDRYMGANGIVTLLHFADGGVTIKIETYSTLKGLFYKKNNQMTVSGVHVIGK